MGKRNNPQTSTDAYKSLDPNNIREMYKKIVSAITDIGPSTYEQIAVHLNEKPERVWKRLSEMGQINLIHRPGDRRIMASGRCGFVWAIGPSPETTTKKKMVMKGPAVQDFSRAINQVKQSIHTQDQLFNL